MTINSIASAISIFAQQNSTLILLFELLFKSLLLLGAVFFIQFLIRGKSASSRSQLWKVSFIILLLLPFFQNIVPVIPITLTLQGSSLLLVAMAEHPSYLQSFQSAMLSLSPHVNTLITVYFLIALGLVLYLLTGIVRVIVLSKTARAIENKQLISMLEDLIETNGGNRRVKILVCDRIQSPHTWGVLSHQILLPTVALQWKPDLLEQVISHELGHIERMDWLYKVLIRLISSFYWFNPLVWLGLRKFTMESEKSCDDYVLDDTKCSLAYAENLLWLARSLRGDRNLLSAALLGSRSQLSVRIKHILNANKDCHFIDRNSGIPALLIAALLAAPCAAVGLSIKDGSRAFHKSVSIPVSFYPKESIEYYKFMKEAGKVQ